MNRSLSTSMVLGLAIAISALVGACDGGPSCHDIVTPTTCDPACDLTAGEFCNEETDECVTYVACDPPACNDGEYCDGMGNCLALPPTCDPTCASGEYCDEGTCRPTPVCDPPCSSNQYCE